MKAPPPIFLDFDAGILYSELRIMAYRTYGPAVGYGFAGWGMTPIVKKLILANVAVFFAFALAQAAGWAQPLRWFMLTPYAVTHQLALWQLVSYLFLHAGFWHILFNMLALWMFGCELERTWGPRKFLRYYFLTGIGAGLTVILLNPSGIIPTVGASGAVYGVLLAYGVLFPNRIIFVPIFFFFFFPIPAKYLVMILGGIAFFSTLSAPGDFISHAAHLGGMVFGYLYLRGRPRFSHLYFDLRNRYYRWRRLRLQRQFRVYMSKHDGKEERRGPPVQ
ncbi:MAG: rhomboid family intramembrane serine protease [Acidobacteria bacterium]|nr:rhomboid family intramembrane serine protease [Acidobacteriota bacterium]